MKDDLDNLEDINKNIEDGNSEKNNDENSSSNFLKIDPIKSLDSSNIKIEIPKTEIKKEVEISKKQTYKQTKDDNREEPKITEDDFQNTKQNTKKIKDNSKIIKIGIVVLVILLCLGGGYFAYSKFMASDEGENLADNTVTEETVEVTEETPKEETNSLAAPETPIAEPVTENFQETVEKTTEPINQETIVEEQPIVEEKISNQTDDYDLVVLDKVYDEVINKGNIAYLNNFSSEELAIIRNTLYAKNGYKFKKKKYQQYFGEKSWYVPTTNSQNILTKNEEKLANIIKRYE